MVKTSQLEAIVKAKCPRCRRGNIFAGSLYGLNLQNTNENCSHCGMRFEVEPGFFYGAMYVSYTFVVVEMLNVGLITYLITGNDKSPWLYITTILLTILALTPINYRYSRVLLLHWLTPKIKYYPEYDTNDKIGHV
ncbi:DUF983 domain-containing protein [Daejeonella sp.]|jgi:uncharacterized protein (DUF983 family)|uniref:DUF983 domain-containing protein n=1 Tax=Daejeonella sp. TaxID=2805397 RepID=UPI0027BA95DD|nr:DUF983 domain-containing protein [Daejeonella sp.]